MDMQHRTCGVSVRVSCSITIDVASEASEIDAILYPHERHGVRKLSEFRSPSMVGSFAGALALRGGGGGGNE